MRTSLVSLLVAAALALPVGAGAAARVAAPLPDLSSTLLDRADFAPGALLVYDRSVTYQGLKMHMRVFSGKLGGKSEGVVDASILLDTADLARGTYEQVVKLTATKQGREELAKAWVSGASAGKALGLGSITISKITVGNAISISGGGVAVPVTTTIAKKSVKLTLAFLSVERVFGMVEVIPTKGSATTADVTRAVAAARARATAAFTVASSAAPTLTGTAQVGQTLTTDGGSWTGAPTTFAYAWSRCAADGSACTAIAGATGATYVVQSGDVGSTLQVTVTGTNTVGTAPASSAKSAPVA